MKTEHCLDNCALRMKQMQSDWEHKSSILLGCSLKNGGLKIYQWRKWSDETFLIRIISNCYKEACQEFSLCIVWSGVLEWSFGVEYWIEVESNFGVVNRLVLSVNLFRCYHTRCDNRHRILSRWFQLDYWFEYRKINNHCLSSKSIFYFFLPFENNIIKPISYEIIQNNQ